VRRGISCRRSDGNGDIDAVSPPGWLDEGTIGPREDPRVDWQFFAIAPAKDSVVLDNAQWNSNSSAAKLEQKSRRRGKPTN
jgi:hypothetical protein